MHPYRNIQNRAPVWRIQHSIRHACRLLGILICLAAGQALAAVDTTSTATEPMSPKPWYEDTLSVDYQQDKFKQKRYFRNGKFKESNPDDKDDLWRTPTAFPDIGTVVWFKQLPHAKTGFYRIKIRVKNAQFKAFANNVLVNSDVNTDASNMKDFMVDLPQRVAGEVTNLMVGVMFGPGSYAAGAIDATAARFIDTSSTATEPMSPKPWYEDKAVEDYQLGKFSQKRYYRDGIYKESGGSDAHYAFWRESDQFPDIGTVVWRKKYHFRADGTYFVRVALKNAMAKAYFDGKFYHSYYNPQDFLNNPSYNIGIYHGYTQQSTDIDVGVMFGPGSSAGAQIFANDTNEFRPVPDSVAPNWSHQATDADYATAGYSQKVPTFFGLKLIAPTPLTSDSVELRRIAAMYNHPYGVAWRRKFIAPQSGTYRFTVTVANARFWLNGVGQQRHDNNLSRLDLPYDYYHKVSAGEILNVECIVNFNGTFWNAGAKFAYVFTADPAPQAEPQSATYNDNVRQRADGQWPEGFFIQKLFAIGAEDLGSSTDYRLEPDLLRTNNQNQNVGLVGWSRTFSSQVPGFWTFTGSYQNGDAELYVGGNEDQHRKFHEYNPTNNFLTETHKENVSSGQSVKVLYYVRFNGGWNAGAKFQATFSPHSAEPSNWWVGNTDEYPLQKYFQQRYDARGNKLSVPGDSYDFYKDSTQNTDVGSVVWRRTLRAERDGVFRITGYAKNGRGLLSAPGVDRREIVNGANDTEMTAGVPVDLSVSGGNEIKINYGVFFNASTFAGGAIDIVFVPTATANANSGRGLQWFADKDLRELRYTGLDAGSNGNVEWTLNGPPQANVPETNCSARWSSYFRAPSAGAYTFRVRADDGIRVFMNGTKVMERWSDDSGTTETEFTYNFTGNALSVPMVVEYYNAGGGGMARIRLKDATNNLDAVIPAAWYQVTNPGIAPPQAINAGYAWGAPGGFPSGSYEMTTWTPFGTFLATTAQQNATLQRSQTQNQNVGIVRWRGIFTAPSAGTYTFTPSVTNGHRWLRINGREDIGNSIALTANQAVQIEYVVWLGAGWDASASLGRTWSAAPPPSSVPLAAVDSGFAWGVPGSFPTSTYEMKMWTPAGVALPTTTPQEAALQRSQTQNQNVGIVRWRRAFTAPSAGTYTFTHTVSNGQRWLRINGRDDLGNSIVCVKDQVVQIECVASFGAGWDAGASLAMSWTAGGNGVIDDEISALLEDQAQAEAIAQAVAAAMNEMQFSEASLNSERFSPIVVSAPLPQKEGGIVRFPYTADINWEFGGKSWKKPGSILSLDGSIKVTGRANGYGPASDQIVFTGNLSSQPKWDLEGRAAIKASLGIGAHWGLKHFNKHITTLPSKKWLFRKHEIHLKCDVSLGSDIKVDFDIPNAGIRYSGPAGSAVMEWAVPGFTGVATFEPKATFKPLQLTVVTKNSLTGEVLETKDYSAFGLEIGGFGGVTVTFDAAGGRRDIKGTKFYCKVQPLKVIWGGLFHVSVGNFSFRYRPQWEKELWKGWESENFFPYNPSDVKVTRKPPTLNN